jgi:transposase
MGQCSKKIELSELLSDAQWDLLRPILFKVRNTQGPQKKQDDRRFIAAVAYLIRTNSHWRQLPAELGDWHAVYMRFRRWEENRIWAQLWRNLDDRARTRFPVMLGIESDMSHVGEDGSYRDVRCRIRQAISMDIW